MKVLIDFPSVVEKYAKFYETCFSPEGFEHFKKALSGFIVSENKTLEAINRLFVTKQRNQSSFNRFFNRQNFDLAQINERPDWPCCSKMNKPDSSPLRKNQEGQSV